MAEQALGAAGIAAEGDVSLVHALVRWRLVPATALCKALAGALALGGARRGRSSEAGSVVNLEAAKLALIGNTAPVAFGSLGTPLVTLAPLTGLDLLQRRERGHLLGVAAGERDYYLASLVQEA